MSDQLVGEVRVYAGETAPDGWAICDGRMLRIEDHPRLYGVIGTTYGGDGRETFAIPNLTGRTAVHAGHGADLVARRLGEAGGDASVQLDEGHLPVHSHKIEIPAGGRVLGKTSDDARLVGTGGSQAYEDKSSAQLMSGSAVGSTGSSQRHNNMQPFLALNYIIALVGAVPEPD